MLVQHCLRSAQALRTFAIICNILFEAKTAAKPAEHATTLAKDPKAVFKPAAATAASPAVAHPVGEVLDLCRHSQPSGPLS